MIVLLKTIRKGQGSNQNLVLDLGLLDVLDGVTCSPFGAVAKGSIAMEVDARNIHNLTFPHGESVNKTYPIEIVQGRRCGGAAHGETVGRSRQQGNDWICKRCFSAYSYPYRLHGSVSGTIPDLGILVVDLICPFG
ncbi:hypothetical protein JG687_00012976 [Phytophthora cactorum]|uniref:Uncharacterized protein n=1 Tax=Phytophthora cactorum TaxID=29920 RepID=A0A8T1U3Y7_9STRA|nr:hypothetical protein JG687_00012976 [Phytophthora cactorum]